MNKWFIFSALIIALLFLYTFKLEAIPANLTGDEVTYLSDIYKILYKDSFVNPLELMGDQSQTATNFYWMALWVKIFGINNAYVAMRFSTVILSILSLIVFYIILNKRFGSIVGFVTILLMGTSVWYINFSRNGWFNLGILLWGSLMIFFLEKGLEEKRLRWIIISGICAGIASYGYMSGKIFPLAAIIYFLILTLFKFNRTIFKSFGIFVITVFITVIPLILIFLNNIPLFLTRPNAVFILKSPLTYKNTIVTLIIQVIDTLKGLLLLDGSVIGKGVENLRYYPPHSSVADIITRGLFLPGAFFIIIKKTHIGIWWILYVLTLIVGALTIDTPNLARTIAILPFIYLVVGLTLFEIIKLLRNKIPFEMLIFIVFAIAITISFHNISAYFKWMQSSEALNARQPAIDYKEFPIWQTYQIQRVKNGQSPVTNYEWYEIRKTLPLK